MARVHIPAETDLLCEGCGYVLVGLPIESNCPECGKAIRESAGDDGRHLTAWETRGTRGLLSTTARVLLSPAEFYRSLLTRGDDVAGRRFARLHWVLASVLFALLAFLHADWYFSTILGQAHISPGWVLLFAWGIYASIYGTTELASRLTAWEAGYRGLRIPRPVALRALHFHAAQYLPVAVVTLLTVAGYQWGLSERWFRPETSATTYLYFLCAEVILAAGYLFNAYWIGMRNIMYANR